MSKHLFCQLSILPIIAVTVCVTGVPQSVAAKEQAAGKGGANDKPTASRLAVVVHPDWASGKRNRESIAELGKAFRMSFAGRQPVSAILGDEANDAPDETMLVVVVARPVFVSSYERSLGVSGKSVNLLIQYELAYRSAALEKWHRLARREVTTYGRASENRISDSGDHVKGITRIVESRRLGVKELAQEAFSDTSFSQAWFNLERDLGAFLASGVFHQYERRQIVPIDVQDTPNGVLVEIGVRNRLPFAVEGVVNISLNQGGKREQFTAGPQEKKVVKVLLPVVDDQSFERLQLGHGVSGSVVARMSTGNEP